MASLADPSSNTDIMSTQPQYHSYHNRNRRNNNYTSGTVDSEYIIVHRQYERANKILLAGNVT